MAILSRVEDQVEVPDRLPVVALRDLVFFPYVVLPILIGRYRSVAALEEAKECDDLVLLVAQKDPGVDDPAGPDLFRVGTIARVVQVTRLPDGTSRVVLEGVGRGRIKRRRRANRGTRAERTSHAWTFALADRAPSRRSRWGSEEERCRRRHRRAEHHDQSFRERAQNPFLAGGRHARLQCFASGS